MSNFQATVVHKKTGEEKQAIFWDDHFGHHRYGIEIDGKILTTDEFTKTWERKEYDE